MRLSRAARRTRRPALCSSNAAANENAREWAAALATTSPTNQLMRLRMEPDVSMHLQTWDIFVQDIPPGVTSVDQMPEGFRAAPIGQRDDIVAAIREIAPDIDFTDPTWGVIRRPDYTIEINIGEEPTTRDFAFHVRGSDEAVDVITRILQRLELRAYDPQSLAGIFKPGPDAVESLRAWRAIHEHVVGKEQ